jgi:hypothetical protein
VSTQRRLELINYWENLSDDLTNHLDNTERMTANDRLASSIMMAAISLRLVAIAIENQG